MKNKVIAMMLVLATIMTTIPVSSVNAFDAECNFKYTDNGLNNNFMNYEEPKSEVTFKYIEKGKKQDLAAKFKQNASKITLKSSNSKNVSVKGTTVTMKKGDATVTMKIALKDGGTKTIKVKIHKTLGSGTRVFDRNNQWNNLPENKKGGCK